MLQSPPTIRLPRPDELPNNPEVFERLKGREQAKIVEGFVLKDNTSHDLPFKFYAEINIDNSKLWHLFTALSTQLPDEISYIYNLYEEEPIYSPYVAKKPLLLFLNYYDLELTQDCNLEFGIIFQSADKLVEVFISESKFVKFWGVDEKAFREIMDDFQLSETPDMKFIDEFPKVVEPLTMFNDKAKSSETVIAEFTDLFNPKPNRKWKLL